MPPKLRLVVKMGWNISTFQISIFKIIIGSVTIRNIYERRCKHVFVSSRLITIWYKQLWRNSINSVVIDTTQKSNLVHATRFWNNLHQVRQQSKDCEANFLLYLGASKPAELNRMYVLNNLHSWYKRFFFVWLTVKR